jgi:hypothetical protein
MSKKLHVDKRSSLERSGGQIDLDGWWPPGGYADCNAWAFENREALEQYAERNEKEGTAAEQLERYLASLVKQAPPQN